MCDCNMRNISSSPIGTNRPDTRNISTALAEHMFQNYGINVPPIEKKRIYINKNRESGSYEPYGSAGAPPELRKKYELFFFSSLLL